LRSKNIRYDEVRRVDDTHIVIRNVPSDQAAQFRTVGDIDSGFDLIEAPQ